MSDRKEIAEMVLRAQYPAGGKTTREKELERALTDASNLLAQKLTEIEHLRGALTKIANNEGFPITDARKALGRDDAPRNHMWQTNSSGTYSCRACGFTTIDALNDSPCAGAAC